MSATQDFAAWMEHSPFALSVDSFHDLTCIMCIPEQTNLGFSKVNFLKNVWWLQMEGNWQYLIPTWIEILFTHIASCHQ